HLSGDLARMLRYVETLHTTNTRFPRQHVPRDFFEVVTKRCRRANTRDPDAILLAGHFLSKLSRKKRMDSPRGSLRENGCKRWSRATKLQFPVETKVRTALAGNLAQWHATGWRNDPTQDGQRALSLFTALLPRLRDEAELQFTERRLALE